MIWPPTSQGRQSLCYSSSEVTQNPAQLEKVISAYGVHFFNQQKFFRMLDF